MNMVDNIFILAGGAGTRLWPASNRNTPKQFLKIKDGKSLLQLTIERALSLEPFGEVYIITLKEQMDAVIEECLKLDEGKEKIVILPEPQPRNTAPAIAAAAGYLRDRGRGGESTLVMPADHLITPAEAFKADAEKGTELAEKGFLVTFGIIPVYPATGYGYIEAGKAAGDGFLVKRFREKPDAETAAEFLEQGGFYWNSGMFLFSPDVFWGELEKSSPGIAKVFDGIGKKDSFRIEKGIGTILNTPELAKIYAASPKDSIDYAVMEKSRSAAVVAASFTWNDIGSWDEMAEMDQEPGENVVSVASGDNFVLSDIPVALCGVEDLVVVQKNGALLICKKGKGQLVKDAVEAVKERGLEHIL